MTNRFVPLQRTVALSAAITLFAAPIASAQTPALASSTDASAHPVLLSPAAFARLLQAPPADVAPPAVVTDSPRPSLLRQATTAMVREAKAASMKAPQQKSWVSRHKALTGLLIGAGAFVGFALCVWACGLDG